jgi:hypothetical protein
MRCGSFGEISDLSAFGKGQRDQFEVWIGPSEFARSLASYLKTSRLASAVGVGVEAGLSAFSACRIAMSQHRIRAPNDLGAKQVN